MEYPASFAFAHYTGKSAGQLVRWVCFNGTFSLTMNDPMLQIIIDAIDAGADHEDGTLEDEACDLVELLDNVQHLPRDTQFSDLFSITYFDKNYTVQCGLTGLKVMKDAVEAGADFASPHGKSLWAFLHEAAKLIERWEGVEGRRKEKEIVPAGYISA